MKWVVELGAVVVALAILRPALPARADQDGPVAAATAPGESPGTRADNALAQLVRDRMVSDRTLRGSSIVVSSQGGMVTVAGSVTSDFARTDALDIARATPGVAGVKDQLRIVVQSPEAPVPFD